MATVTVDITAPAVPTIITPTDGTSQRAASVAVAGTADPGGRVTVLNSGAFTYMTDVDENGEWQVALCQLNSGANAITAFATAVNGSSALDLWATAWDGSPTYAFTTSAVTATIENSPQDVEISLQHTGDAVAPDEGYWEAEYAIASQVSHGPHDVVFRGLDSSGYLGDRSYQGLYVDRWAPAMPIIQVPSGDMYTSQSTMTVQGEADKNSMVVLSVVNAGGTSSQTVKANAFRRWEIEIALQEGSNSLTAMARDDAGNETDSTPPIVVTRDTTSPQIDGHLQPDPARAGYPITLTAVVTEAGQVRQVIADIEDVGDYILELDAGNYVKTLTLPDKVNLSDGWKDVTFTAEDRSNHTGVYTTTFLVDTTPPIVETFTIEEDSAYIFGNQDTIYYGSSSGVFTLTVAVTDVTAGLDAIFFLTTVSAGDTYTQGGGISATVPHTYSFDAATNISGVYTITDPSEVQDSLVNNDSFRRYEPICKAYSGLCDDEKPASKLFRKGS